MAAHRIARRLHPLNSTRRTHPLRVKSLALAVMGTLPIGWGTAAWSAPPDVRLPVAQNGTQTLNGKAIVFNPLAGTPGNAVTVKVSNTATGANMDVTQQAQRAITQWQSFNVGANASVNFNMPTANSAMLARVVPTDANGRSLSPSQILGSVRTSYVDAAGRTQTGGELFLINGAGWLFGSSAKVNVGGLIASTLDIQNSDFLNGLQSIQQAQATFSWQYVNGGDQTQAQAAALYHADGLVQVDQGASITTASGGRVFLFAPTVVNNGTVSTPNGQTVLAGGSEVYLNNPQQEKLYASESNSNVPAVKGLLVEVNNGPNGELGSVTNNGEINTPSGNTTLVAMAVRQAGHISASTSSAGNGSVLLTARSNVVAGVTNDVGSTTLTKQAQQAGSLVLTGSSRIDLLPDDSAGTTAASTAFTTSRVELEGKTIDLQANSRITAPGGIVEARAEATPTYMGVTAADPTFYQRVNFAKGGDDASARITLGANAVIDVAGTTSAQVNGARNFVTPSLVTNTDLADAPLQKLNPALLHSENATFDLRAPVPMFSSTQGYKDALQLSATERLSAGGTVNLHSTGAVVTHADSTIDISGGQVNFSATTAQVTQLQDVSGNFYTLNTAPIDRVYTLAKPLTVQEAAYVQGSAAGQLHVVGSQVVMPGQVVANTVTGLRQLQGKDPLAARAQVSVNAWLTQGDRNAASVDAAMRKVSIDIGRQVQGASADYWSEIESGARDDMKASLPTGSVLGLSVFGSNMGSVTVNADGALHWLAGNSVGFVPGAVLSLSSRGGAGLHMDSSIRDAGGRVSLTALNLTDDANSVVLSPTQGLFLADGQSIDVSGRFVNRARDGDLVAPVGVAGGTITLASASDLSLGSGSVLDVSGGAVLAKDGKALQGQAAGSLAIEAGTDVRSPTHHLSLGAELRGYSFTQGGSLTLEADSVQIGGQADAHAPDRLLLSPDFFTQHGFGSYSLQGHQGVTLSANTQLTPLQRNWVANAALFRSETDTPLAALTRVVDLGANIRATTNLSLGSTYGGILVDQGAVILTDNLAQVSLNAARYIDLEGRIVDHGGLVSLSVTPNPDLHLSLSRDSEGVVWLGQQSLIDVSGTSVITPGTGILRQGTVLDGGTVQLAASDNTDANGGLVVMTEGSHVNIAGALDHLDIAVQGSAGTKVRNMAIASAGGTLSVHGAHGAVLEGTVDAQGGDGTAVAGSFLLDNTAQFIALSNPDKKAFSPGVYGITLQADAARTTAGMGFDQHVALFNQDAVWGQTTVSSSWLNRAGFADVTLKTGDRIRAVQSATIAAARNLTLSAQAIQVLSGQTLSLSAPNVTLDRNLSLSADTGLHFDATTTGGSGTLDIAALRLGLAGAWNLQGIGALNVHGREGVNSAANEVELSGGSGLVPMPGVLNAQADIAVRAKEVFPDTDASFTIHDEGHTVRFAGGDTSLAKPLSAGGSLTIYAQDIEQGGVLRAPFGQITLQADTIHLLDGSETSVSGAGLLVPFGLTINGSQWIYAQENDVRTALLGKQINLNSNASTQGSITVSGQATIDASGGGDVYAREFIAGPGGSKNIFAGAAGGAFAVVPLASVNQTGYAVSDRQILNEVDASGAKASISPGQLVTFGNNGVLPAGTYVVMPAAYGTLPGSYLVKADTAGGRVAAVDLSAPAIALQDGSTSVAGQISYTGTGYSTPASRFIVMNHDLASTHSQVNLTSGAGFFAAQAAKQQVATPLPQDGGTVRALASVLSGLQVGTLKLGGADTGLGGTLELGVDQIRVTDQAQGDPGVTELSAASLNASGAQTVILGATRGALNAAGERELQVTASQIDVEASSQPDGVKVNDLTLVATDAINLHDGAVLTSSASSALPVEAFHVNDGGASVRVSADPNATLTRANVTRPSGSLTVGRHTRLASASGRVLMEASQQVTLDPSLTLKAQGLTLGAPRLAFGATPSTLDALRLNGPLLSQIGQIADVVLRSYSSIDFFQADGGGPLAIGGAGLATLTLDAGTLQGHDGVTVDISAGRVVLANSSGAAALATQGPSDTGQLRIHALDAQGDVTVRTGSIDDSGQLSASSMGVSGFASARLDARRSVVLDGQGGGTVLGDTDSGNPGGLNVAGDLSIQAASLTATSGSNTALLVSGMLGVDAASQGALGAVSGLGAHVNLQADTIRQAGVIDLRSGWLSLHATGPDSTGAAALSLLDGSQTLLSGTRLTLGNQTVDTMGGFAYLTADQGSIAVSQGARVDVSAGGTDTQAGELHLSATQGAVRIQGTLLGNAVSSDLGGVLTVDAQSGLSSLDALAQSISAGQQAGQVNFGQTIAVRSRGDEGLTLSQGQQLSANDLRLVSDQGSVSISGALHADTANGGHILLAAGQDVALQGSAQLSAQALAPSDNTLYSNARIDLQSAGGQIVLAQGSRIDLRAAAHANSQLNTSLLGGDADAAGGVLALRALRTADGNGIQLAQQGVQITGARAVQLEGVKVWQQPVNGKTGRVGSGSITTLDGTGTASGALSLNTVLNDAKTFAGHAQTMASSFSAGDSKLASKVEVRAGEEIQTDGDLNVTADWNLSQLPGTGPVNLTLRAAGNVNLGASVSSGFITTAPTSATQSGSAGDIRIVAGADLSGASALATQAGSGDLLIGNPGGKAVLVRSTTGNIELAAGHDINLQADNAAVYTTGQHVSLSGGAAADQPVLPSNLKQRIKTQTTSSSSAYPSILTQYQSLGSGPTVVDFYTQGGNVSLDAAHDVLGVPSEGDGVVSANAWLYTTYLSGTGQTAWWTRYDKFTQGVAALAGGNVNVHAGGAVQDLQVAAAGGGFSAPASSTSQYNFGAGALDVQAGTNIWATNALNTGDRLSLRAGNQIGASQLGGGDSAATGSSALSFNGLNQVSGIGSVQLSALGDAAQASQFLAVLAANSISQSDQDRAYRAVSALGVQATARVQSAGGDIQVASSSGLLQTDVQPSGNVTSVPVMNASDLRLLAPTGSINWGGTLSQILPAEGGGLSALAGQSLSIGSTLYQRGAANGGFNDSQSAMPLGWDTATARTPATLVAASGDLTLAQVYAVRPLDVWAGRDLVLGDAVFVQQQSAQDLSVLQAGRDILLPNPSGSSITVRGPGDLLLVAGRDVNLGIQNGLVSNGNQDNTALPAQSANVTVMAGVKLASLDAGTQMAQGRYPQLLGGLAFLTALPAEQELDAVRNALALLGVRDSFDNAFNTAQTAYVASLSASQGVSTFGALGSDLQARFIKDFLSNHVLGNADSNVATPASPQDFNLTRLMSAAVNQLPSNEARNDLVSRFAGALGSPYQASLVAFVEAQTGQFNLNVTQALSAYATLPVARQALFQQAVLYSELRQAGRSAKLATSTDQSTADYQRGYDALASLFPAATAQSSGDIILPQTTLRSYQGGAINMLAPVGGVDGGVTTSSASAGTGAGKVTPAEDGTSVFKAVSNQDKSINYGVVALGGGAVNAAIGRNLIVNTSRVFTLGGGSMLLWSSEGNIDAGKGARTVSGVPAPVYYLDTSGQLKVDVTAAISGSGIASSGDLDAYAPHGIIDSGDAGLRSAGVAFLGAQRVVCLGCAFSGGAVGLSSGTPSVSPLAPTSALPDNTRAGQDAANDDDDKKKKKKKRQIELDFLGFGVAFTNPIDWMSVPGLSDWWARAEAQAQPQSNKSVLLSLYEGVRRRWY